MRFRKTFVRGGLLGIPANLQKYVELERWDLALCDPHLDANVEKNALNLAHIIRSIELPPTDLSKPPDSARPSRSPRFVGNLSAGKLS